MSEAVTMQDIDEVLGVLQDFMGQVADQFGEVSERFDEQDRKYDHLINAINCFVGRIDKY